MSTMTAKEIRERLWASRGLGGIELGNDEFEDILASLDHLTSREALERCEGAMPECGPVEFHDSEGVPLCRACYESLEQETKAQQRAREAGLSVVEAAQPAEQLRGEPVVVAYRYRAPEQEGAWTAILSHARASALRDDGFIVEPLVVHPGVSSSVTVAEYFSACQPKPEQASGEPLDFSRPMETLDGKPVKWVFGDVVEHECARIGVDKETGVVYSSPYFGLRIRNVVQPKPEQAVGDGVVAWYSKQYGVVWSGKQLRDMEPGTNWFIEGSQEPVATVKSGACVIWHISTSSLAHGTKFYDAPRPAVATAGGGVASRAVAYRYRKRGCGGTWRYGSISHRNKGSGPDPSVYEVEHLYQDALASRPVEAAQGGVMSDDLVGRLKVAARALVRERKVYAEDVETLHDVLRVMEALASPSARVAVPEERTEANYEQTERFNGPDPYSLGHMDGWNDCRNAMLAAAPEVPK